jgi:general secretion pathway protein G
MQRQLSRTRGFTLLEIMLVVSIIALLLGAALVAFKGPMEQARRNRIDTDLRAITNGLKMYEMTSGRAPTSEQGIRALVERPTTEPAPKQWSKFLESIPKDPWDNEYVYRKPGKRNPNGYDLFSKGEDAMPDTADDIGNWDTTQKK